jgi:hypothetical protein
MVQKTTVREASRKTKKSSRRHGYRGYGSGVGRGTASYGGKVHWGRGFTGIAFPEAGGESLLESGLLTPGLKEKASRR